MTPQDVAENLQFKGRCLLGLDNSGLDVPIYRVFPIDRLIQLFTTKKNTLVKPSMWDDPFENLVFQQTATIKSGESVHFDEIREMYFGQCWTLNIEETDALWRIYSPSKDGVRVQTTLRKLWDSFYDPNYQWAMVSFFLGKIKYSTAQEIKDFYENPDELESIFDTSGGGAVDTLLVKRTEFLHENEVRLIFKDDNQNPQSANNLYQYSIEPNDLFDTLLFDPRFDESTFAMRTAAIKNLGFSKQIEKSSLYQIPKFNLRLNH